MLRPTLSLDLCMSLSRRDLLGGLSALGICPLSPWPCLQRGFVKGTALQFGLLPDEAPDFRDAYEVYRRLLPQEVRGHVHREGVVSRAIEWLGEFVTSWRQTGEVPTSLDLVMCRRRRDGEPMAPVRSIDDSRPVVIFSDHHLTLGAHRHNVFSGEGGSHFQRSNRGLYLAVLQQYLQHAEDWVLVENGDLEDLVVFDPALHPGELAARRRLMDGGGETHELVGRLEEHRAGFRRGLCADILADPANRPYYEMLARFDERDRLLRVGGNHDYQVAEFWEEATDRARRVSRLRYSRPSAHCTLLTVGRWALVMHGHQFDHVSSPVHAPQHGETISECLGAFYQGGDRVWPWEVSRQWASGRPFRNVLVSGIPTSRDELRALVEQTDRQSVPGDEARRRLWNRSAIGPEFWEQTFGHPIAWEYFGEPDGSDTERVQSDSLEHVYRTIALGSTWFKFRHTEELELAELLPQRLQDTPPTLVLGHTHEPRQGAIDADGQPVDWYLNSGAAGRFEGLIWGVELRQGQAQVVSWHPDPFPDGPPQRRVWQATGGEWRHLLQSRSEGLA
jgi:hypothetical protein